MAARKVPFLPARFTTRNNAGICSPLAPNSDRPNRLGRQQMAICSPQVCSPVRVRPICSLAANWTYTGLFNLRRLVADEDFHALFRSQGTQQTRLGSDIESRFWLSYRPTNRRTWRANGSSARCSLGCILRMTASPVSLRAGAAAMCCWPESRHTWACVPECTFGSEWIGTLHIRQAHSSCPCAVTSVLGSRNSFDCIFKKKGGTMNKKQVALLLLFCSVRWCLQCTSANQAH